MVVYRHVIALFGLTFLYFAVNAFAADAPAKADDPLKFDGWYTIVNKKTGHHLFVTSDNKNQGNWVSLHDANDVDNEKWSVHVLAGSGNETNVVREEVQRFIRVKYPSWYVESAEVSDNLQRGSIGIGRSSQASPDGRSKNSAID